MCKIFAVEYIHTLGLHQRLFSPQPVPKELPTKPTELARLLASTSTPRKHSQCTPTHVFNHVYNYWWLFPKYAASSSQTNTQTWSCTEELGCVNMCHEIKMRSFKVGRTCSKHDPLMERGRKADQRWVCWLSYNSWVSHGNRSKGRGTKARWVEVTGCSLTTMKRRSSRSSL